MLIALLISLFFGGGQDDFMMPSIEKYTKKNLDKASKKIVLETLDDHADDVKAFYKDHNKQISKFQQKRLAKDISEEQFDAFFAKRIAGYKNLDSLSLLRRNIIRTEFTQKQWNEALKDIDKTLTKREKALAKKRKELDSRIDKLHNKVERLILKKVPNPSARLIIQSFQQNLNIVLSNYVTTTDELNTLLLNYNTDDNILTLKKNEIIELRQLFYNQFKKTYFDLTNIMTEKEWKMISRRFNKAF